MKVISKVKEAAHHHGGAAASCRKNHARCHAR